jgi:hydrogenase/urease accessory protein HupE
MNLPLARILPLAHLTPTGLGPWADGMARLVLEPADLLLVRGLVLQGVQAGRPWSDRLPVLLPFAWLLVGLVGLALPSPLLLALPCTALVAVVGLLVALEVRLRLPVLLPMAAVLIGLFALVAGSALAGHPGALAALLGESVAIAGLSTLLCQSLAPPTPRWRAIGLRVGGSWITAASLLMLGWLVRHPQ